MKPRVYHFRGGWSASGHGFAAFAATREEAEHQYWQHMIATNRCSAPGCTAPAATALDGVLLCTAHHAYVTSHVDSSGADSADATLPTESDCPSD